MAPLRHPRRAPIPSSARRSGPPASAGGGRRSRRSQTRARPGARGELVRRLVREVACPGDPGGDGRRAPRPLRPAPARRKRAGGAPFARRSRTSIVLGRSRRGRCRRRRTGLLLGRQGGVSSRIQASDPPIRSVSRATAAAAVGNASASITSPRPATTIRLPSRWSSVAAPASGLNPSASSRSATPRSSGGAFEIATATTSASGSAAVATSGCVPTLTQDFV